MTDPETTTPEVTDPGFDGRRRLVRSDVSGSRTRRLAVWALEIWVLSAFAVAQPLFGVLGDGATFFVAHRASTGAIFALVLVLVMGVPAVLFALDCVAESLDAMVAVLRGRFAPILHTIVLGVLLSAIVVPPLARSLELRAALWVTALVVVAPVGAALFARVVVLRRIVRYAAFAPVLFAVLFLFFSPVSALIGGSDNVAAVRGQGPGSAERSIPGPGGVDTPPVVWMVLDEFSLSLVVGPDGEIVSDRFPNLARLASMSTWYPRYTAGAVFTQQAVPAMLTGRWPDEGQLPIASELPENVFTILSGPDYPVTAYESVTDLCPPEVCEDRPEPKPIPLWGDTWAVYVRYLLPGPLADRFVARVDEDWADFGGGDGPTADAVEAADPDGAVPTPTSIVDPGSEPSQSDEPSEEDRQALVAETARWAELAEMVPDFNGNVDLFDRFVAPLRAGGLRGLHYLHMRLPHGPIRYLPDGRKYVADFEARTGDRTAWPDDEPTTRTMMHRVIVQAMFADNLVGRMLDALEESGDLDRTAIIVSSDHGSSYRPGVAARSIDDPDSALDSVPSLLLIKEPGQASGRVDRRRAQQVDILPTLLELIGIEVRDRPRGSSDRTYGVAMTDAHDARWADRVPVKVERDGPVEYRDAPVATDSPTVEWIPRILPDPTRPYAVGPFGDVVGLTDDGRRPVVSPHSIALDSPHMFDDVITEPVVTSADDFHSRFVPALITGVVTDATDAVHVAVVVNGRIAGVGESFSFQGVQRISILIDPDTLRPGRNDVSFLIAPTGTEPGDVPDGASSWESLPSTD